MLDFIREIFASFRQSSLERVKSPFLGAFVFSWIGFNWPMLAILFFSNREIEKRLVYIDLNFGIGTYLLGPLSTAALIALLLPQINKLVTRIQDKPNSDTVELSLASKVRIAQKQQVIAEIEAKKKLAEKKEEKYIEESIHQIKLENKKLTIEVKELVESLNKTKGDALHHATEAAGFKSHLKVEAEAKSQLNKELSLEKENNRRLNEQVIKLNQQINTLSNETEKNSTTLFDLQLDLSKIKKEKEEMQNQHKILSEAYPQIFFSAHMNGKPLFGINHKAAQFLKDINDTLINKDSNLTPF
ncbi:hypothetical protein ACR2RQ_002923 [Cronobacter dublinensis]